MCRRALRVSGLSRVSALSGIRTRLRGVASLSWIHTLSGIGAGLRSWEPLAGRTLRVTRLGRVTRLCREGGLCRVASLNGESGLSGIAALDRISTGHLSGHDPRHLTHHGHALELLNESDDFNAPVESLNRRRHSTLNTARVPANLVNERIRQSKNQLERTDLAGEAVLITR